MKIEKLELFKEKIVEDDESDLKFDEILNYEGEWHGASTRFGAFEKVVEIDGDFEHRYFIAQDKDEAQRIYRKKK